MRALSHLTVIWDKAILSCVKIEHTVMEPDKTEVWSYHTVEKNAPQEVRCASQEPYVRHGASGNMDQDDMNNWVQCTQSGKYPSRPKDSDEPQLGIGRSVKTEGWPGWLNACPSEQNPRLTRGDFCSNLE